MIFAFITSLPCMMIKENNNINNLLNIISMNLYPPVNQNATLIIFKHGLYTDDLYIIEDPTSEWNDSDGDGVWDGIDGAPGDPDAGYIKDNPLTFSPCGGVILPMSIMVMAVWGRWRI